MLKEKTSKQDKDGDGETRVESTRRDLVSLNSAAILLKMYRV